MTRVLYELAGAGEVRFSPNCWRSIYALHHKGLPFERRPIKFSEKDRIAFSGQNLVPVLQDGEARNNFLSGLKVRDEGARTC